MMSGVWCVLVCCVVLYCVCCVVLCCVVLCCVVLWSDSNRGWPRLEVLR